MLVGISLRSFTTTQAYATETRRQQIKYERLRDFCYTYGYVWHTDFDRELGFKMKENGDQILKQYRLESDFMQIWLFGDHLSLVNVDYLSVRNL
ncbi:hypothetical protein SLE2022_083090 [Rubroshorea leprosula]